MSYDVWLIAPACDHCKRGGEEVYSFNLTHNVNGIVDACLKAWGDVRAKDDAGGSYTMRSWGALDGWRASDATPILERAVEEANDPRREREFRAMEPSNGWGKLDDVRRVLSEFLSACQQHPDASIRASG
jgi:hypothetical protein